METTRIIEEYLDGTMDEENRRAVEDRAEHDPDFRHLIRIHREVNECIRNRELSLFRDAVCKVSTEYFDGSPASLSDQPNRSVHASVRLYLRIAAITVIILSAGAILRTVLFSKMSPDYLYEKYYTVYRSDLLHRASQQGETLFSQAILDYEQGNLAKASIGFDSLILRDPGNQLVVFYRGLASLGNGDTDDAIRLFSTIPDSLNDPFNEHRRWYLSLALLAAEDIAGASEILKQISESKGYYAKKADRILRRLGS